MLDEFMFLMSFLIVVYRGKTDEFDFENSFKTLSTTNACTIGASLDAFLHILV